MESSLQLMQSSDISQNETCVNSVKSDRKLVTIVKVQNLKPIQGADLIEIAEIEGWDCVVKKGDFKIGDTAVYFAIDSIPDFTDDSFEFLKEKGAKRIKTMKLRGVISQGLLGPLEWMSKRGHDISNLSEGDDVTEQMGATKYVKDEELNQYVNTINANGSVKVGSDAKKFPSDINKTNEERLQGCLNLLKKIVDKRIVITRKEDGSSGTYAYKNGEFFVCSRNLIVEENSSNAKHYYNIEKKFDIGTKMKNFNRNIAIQGEIVGPNINCNRLQLSSCTYEVFNIFDIDTQSYLSHDEVTQICEQFGLPQVPVIYDGDSYQLLLDIGEKQTEMKSFGELSTDLNENSKKILNGFLKMADNLQYTPKSPAEGIVIKNAMGGSINRISFKVISNKYLLKHDA